MAGSLYDTVQEWARRTPDALAVEFGDEQVSYRELDQRSRRLAQLLEGLGVGPDVVVGLATPRGVESILGILAILGSGGAWLPLDPTYPARRLEFMVRDSGVRMLLTNDDSVLAGCEVKRINFDALPPRQGARGPAATPANLAYLIFTSGSTGRPKGVMVSRAAMANLAAAQADAFGVRPGHRVLQFAPASFDASVFEVTMALHAGATLVLAPHGQLLPGSGLADLLRRARITHVTLPPSVLAALPPVDLPELETLICAGEALPEALVRRWSLGRQMFNAYGPTETTVWASIARVHPGPLRPSIGVAIRGARLAVLDPELRPVEPGQPGELIIGGAGVARGYHGRPQLTGERFVPDPLAGPDEPGARSYRTGDLAVQRPDGSLEFLGRIDQQIKLRGVRIEPDEISAVLVDHPNVSDAVVLLDGDQREAQPGDGRLLAYAAGREVTPADLHAYLRDRLPPPMVPAAIVVLPALPLTPSGKVDRAALPPPDRASAGLSTEQAALRNPTQARVAALIATLLGRPDVGAEDSFFALGGHSLLTAQLLAQIRDQFGVEVALRHLYQEPTVAAIAAAIDSDQTEPLLPPVVPVARDTPLPLSYPQERIWFLEKLAPGNLAYNAQATIRLRGPLDPAVLAGALRAIVARHEILRTRFWEIDGVPVQAPVAVVATDLAVMDLTSHPAGQREQRAEEAIRQFQRAPFDLGRPPLIRWLLLRHDRNEHTLVQVEHHFVHDGWSFAVLVTELQELYRAIAVGEPSALPAPPIQYADFAVWQRQWMSGEVLDRHVRHWRERLAGSPTVLDLPTDHPRPPLQSFAGSALRRRLPDELSRKLRSFAREHGVSLFTTMLAGFGVLLLRFTGQDDVLVGTGAANRRSTEIQSLVGMVVNTLVLRLDLSGQPGFAELVRRVHEVTIDAHAWQDVPLDRLVEAVAPPRDPARNPLFQVMFSFHDSPVPDLDFCGIHGAVVERHNESAKTDLNIVVIPRAEQRVGRQAHADDEAITLIWEYATDLFERETMLRMEGHYERLLAAALGDDQNAIDRLPLTEDGSAGSMPEATPPHRSTIDRSWTPVPQLVTAQARRTPGRVALSWSGGSLTYAELDRRAGDLARRLVRLGVGPEVLVAVCADRCPELVIGQLGVLKAGGAFLPIDSEYPTRRIADVLADARPHVLLTTGAHSAALPDFGGHIVVLDGTGEAHHEVPPAAAVEPRSLAYVIYTSGSSGRPKGVALTHAGLANLVRWHIATYELGGHDRTALLASPGFDASVWEIWPTLAAGASLTIVPDDLRSAPGELAAWLVRTGITVTFVPTVIAEAVLDVAWPPDTPLRVLLTGGDVLSRRPPPGLPFRLVNHYGPTENTVVATAATVEPGDDARRPPIGRPIAGVRVHVLDAAGEPVPVGAVGELYLGGTGVARGYLRRPGLTAARFVADPTWPTGQQRLYRTGDLVRWRADATLEFCGRVDDQVQIRGYRVEPAEVTAMLRRHPHVREAAVVASQGRSGDRRLVAYAATAEKVTADDVLRFLRSRLPSYMVPADVIFLPTLPITAHGKLDRRALPAPTAAMAGGQTPPRTPTERRVAELVADLLGHDSVGVDDDFFQLGGHSLLANRLLARVSLNFGVEVGLRHFLAAPTVAGLAGAISTAAAEASAAAAIPPTPRRDGVALLDRVNELSDDELSALLDELDEGRQ